MLTDAPHQFYFLLESLYYTYRNIRRHRIPMKEYRFVLLPRSRFLTGNLKKLQKSSKHCERPHQGKNIRAICVSFQNLKNSYRIFNPLTTNVSHYIETSQLICNANQLTDFYMIVNIGR